jgi:hypothetical protein
MTQPIHHTKKRVADGKGKMSAQGEPPVKLLVAMTGKASAAKTASGDEPVFAYIASLPQPQRGIAERIDALAAKSLPGVQRAVKWDMAYYGVEAYGEDVDGADLPVRLGRWDSSTFNACDQRLS